MAWVKVVVHESRCFTNVIWIILKQLDAIFKRVTNCFKIHVTLAECFTVYYLHVNVWLSQCDFYPTLSIFPTFSALRLSAVLMLTLKGRRRHHDSKTFSGSTWLVQITGFWKHFQQFFSCRTCWVILQGNHFRGDCMEHTLNSVNSD